MVENQNRQSRVYNQVCRLRVNNHQKHCSSSFKGKGIVPLLILDNPQLLIGSWGGCEESTNPCVVRLAEKIESLVDFSIDSKEIKCLHLYWITLSAIRTVLLRSPVRATLVGPVLLQEETGVRRANLRCLVESNWTTLFSHVTKVTLIR